jgi:hypothetical protein
MIRVPFDRSVVDWQSSSCLEWTWWSLAAGATVGSIRMKQPVAQGLLCQCIHLQLDPAGS